LGWALRGKHPETDSREARFVADLDIIATQAANLDLICSGRSQTARQLSESRLYEAVKRADDLTRSGFHFRDARAIPNLTEGVWRAIAYAKANAAAPEAVERAERLYAWLRAQQGPAT